MERRKETTRSREISFKSNLNRFLRSITWSDVRLWWRRTAVRLTAALSPLLSQTPPPLLVHIVTYTFVSSVGDPKTLNKNSFSKKINAILKMYKRTIVGLILIRVHNRNKRGYFIYQNPVRNCSHVKKHQISACAASSNQWAIYSKGAGRVSEDFTGGWSGGSSIIAPPLSLLAPRSSGTNKASGTLFKMAQTNQLPVIPRPRKWKIREVKGTL